MRVDQRRSLHRTILTVAVLLLSASAVAAPWRRLPWARNMAPQHHDVLRCQGNFVGSSLTVGLSTSFFGRDGAFQGTLSRTGDTTNFYDRAGRYQGYVTTVPPPAAGGTFNSKRRW